LDEGSAKPRRIVAGGLDARFNHPERKGEKARLIVARLLQEVLLAHSGWSSFSEPITVILAEVEGPELAALLGFVYTGSTTVPRSRLEAFLHAAEALRIRLPALPAPGDDYVRCEQCPEGCCGPLWPSPAPLPPDYHPAGEDLSCRESCWRLPRRQVANQVTASPWHQILRPHHSPKLQPIVLQSHHEPLVIL
jgi:hypothetical protein